MNITGVNNNNLREMKRVAITSAKEYIKCLIYESDHACHDCGVVTTFRL